MKKLIIFTVIFSLISMMNITSVYAYTNAELDSLISNEKEIQKYAHEMAECARHLGYKDEHSIIQTAKSHWHSSEDKIQHYKSQYNKIDYSKYYTQEEAVILAKIMYREARGLPSSEQSKVAWCVLNRVDKWGGTVKSQATKPNQFAYKPNTKTIDDDGTDLVALANEVLKEWVDEKYGVQKGTRTLGKGYLYFYGDGKINHFR